MAFLGLPGPPFLLCIFIIITIPIMITKSAMNDAEALIRIKQSLNNPQSLDSWKLGTSPCDETIKWAGLVCGNGVVTTLRLRSLNLSGDVNVFALSQLQGLRILNIANNSFSGPIPDFNKLGALKAIYLSMNHFSGQIPPGYFTKMVSLKKIWFDHNNFSGPIPSSLAQLPRLLELHLNNNNFSGFIPLIGQQTLESLNLSTNRLTGDIPSSLSRFDVEVFEGNPGLCGPKFGRQCAAMIVPPPPPPSEPPHKSLKIAYLLMALSGFILVSMIIAIYVLVKKKQKEEADQMYMESRNVDDHGSFGLNISSSVSVAGQSEDEESCAEITNNGDGGDDDFMLLNNKSKGSVFGLSDLMKASAEVLGNGSLGSSYKAKLANGLILVVKRLKVLNKMMDKDGLKREMKRLGRLDHPNVLAPLACHYQNEENLIVVYEYIPKGSLLYLLHGDDGELEWAARLKIIKGIAVGMGYIHTELAMLAMPHGNLKSSNVLVGPDNEALVGDYGLVSIMDEKVAASVLEGYKAPEADSVSAKSDVYSLGIVILEIVTGKMHKKGIDLVEWVRNGGIYEEKVAGEMKKVLEIGASCTESNPEKRIDIREAIRRIEEIK